MKNGLICILAGILMLGQSTSFALVAGPVQLTGTIKSFDEKKITIDGQDHVYEVPRDFVDEKQLKSNRKIDVLFSQDQVDKIRIRKKPKN